MIHDNTHYIALRAAIEGQRLQDECDRHIARITPHIPGQIDVDGPYFAPGCDPVADRITHAFYACIAVAAVFGFFYWILKP